MRQEVDHEALARLKAASGDAEKTKEWNQYREQHPDWKPVLSTRDDQADLTGIQFPVYSGGFLRPVGVNLSGLTLIHANLSGAYLPHPDLRGARLYLASLNEAYLAGADLSAADLREADLSGATLHQANMTGAHLDGADLRNANVFDVRYERYKMDRKCRGVRAATCYGNALFRRDAEDQDYIDSLRYVWCSRAYTVGLVLSDSASLNGTFSREWRQLFWRLVWAKLNPRYILFQLWRWIDYGRSMFRVAAFATSLTIVFGFVYYANGGLLHYERHTPDWWYTPFYYSIVTYTTLGFGDVTPRTPAGQVVVTAEVICGYLTLGLLVSVVASKVGRRS